MGNYPNYQSKWVVLFVLLAMLLVLVIAAVWHP
jgi:hypothetical protein